MHSATYGARSRRLILGTFAVLLWVALASARAESHPDWLTDEVLKTLFPGALHTGALTGSPPAVTVHGAGRRLGYVFVTADIVDTVGFSGAPFTIVVGLDMDGTMTGAVLAQHAEPILDYNSPTAPLLRFFNQ